MAKYIESVIHMKLETIEQSEVEFILYVAFVSSLQ